MDEQDFSKNIFPLGVPLETVKIVDNGVEEYKWLKLRKHFNWENDELQDCYELVDGGLYRCKKCGAIIKSNPEKPTFCTECNRITSFDTIAKQTVVGYWDDIVFKPYEPIELNLFSGITDLLKKAVVLKDENEYIAMTLAIIGSWKIECFPSYPYLLFQGTIESGKTRALDLIRLLSYHGMSAGAISLPALARLVELYKVTLTEDEAQVAFDLKTSDGRERLKIYKVGYRKGQKYIVADKDDPDKIIARDVYSFKAMASEKSLDSALQSRSIVYWMEEAEPEIRDLATIEKMAEEIRSRLLIYRYFTPDPPKLEELDIDTGLRGRLEEIFKPLFRVALSVGEGKEVMDALRSFAKKQKAMKLQELGGTLYTTILFYLYDKMHDYEYPKKVLIKDIATFCDVDTRKIGRGLKNLHILTMHSREGNFVDMENPDNIERLNYLFKKFDVTSEAVQLYKEVAGKSDDKQAKLS